MIESRIGEIFTENGFLIKCISCSNVKGRICNKCIINYYYYELGLRSMMHHCDVCFDTDRTDGRDVYFIKLPIL